MKTQPLYSFLTTLEIFNRLIPTDFTTKKPLAFTRLHKKHCFNSVIPHFNNFRRFNLIFKPEPLTLGFDKSTVNLHHLRILSLYLGLRFITRYAPSIGGDLSVNRQYVKIICTNPEQAQMVNHLVDLLIFPVCGAYRYYKQLYRQSLPEVSSLIRYSFPPGTVETDGILKTPGYSRMLKEFLMNYLNELLIEILEKSGGMPYDERLDRYIIKNEKLSFDNKRGNPNFSKFSDPQAETIQKAKLRNYTRPQPFRIL